MAIEKHADGIRIGSVKSKLQERVEAASLNPSPQNDPSSTENRIALLLDASGSMSDHVTDNKQKYQLLHDAVEAFTMSTDFTNSAIAIETFPPMVSLPLCAEPVIITVEAKGVHPTGCTPMAQTMETALHNVPMTRAIIVSDGQPDSVDGAYHQAQVYKEASIPIDTVHIGRGEQGEDCLRRIAEITGGLYIKFTDVNSFAKNFKWLSPMLRSQLLGLPPKDRAQLLGAKEVK